ncbi:electron transfer flavoprotein subunit alpha/FixB family protein [Flavobacteriaceae bacterium]|jgi:electron transfer flavoprotein alpha subunit|nr:electron transfer flavoprotein subunit alpha/FixB family protein [Flavobacteriaceae bacterium]MDB4027466.1 electron transfer flavoprotein subunit alpha/FixB family protein [bacterium]MBT4313693.1 electron transfer flavoprotein subunit alpha/FixB family protein [Flavobacteriaceae bacterium]MBT5090843.1 electron transfer flavoprotein subunit alpha/FixB family protein [Flavobacteriaceae bacterium]MBT5282760.1 electron transfer flavoprotein subunit alpha/FixB family protein [Flavobacteriaceae ba|tara:strand:- start:7067 stop:8020 length:954 start_codon:yes stop_codon:yes gene_type:complete
MSVVVYVESQNGVIKKAGLEVASYGRAIANATNTSLIAVTFNTNDSSVLNSHGVDKVYNINTAEDSFFNVDRYSASLVPIIEKEEASIVVVSATADGRYLGPILAVGAQAAYFSNVVALPSSYAPLTVKRSCFTNKAFNESVSNQSKAVICLSSNAFGLKEQTSNAENLEGEYLVSNSTLKVTAVDKVTDKVTIADADIVVSGGRGLKGPENWHLIEDLAAVLGAATACSKPVSDMGWRPHSEHVGQTGKPVASNLYIAIGVSGAIQHLAGINSSKIKVVINNDPEAPFFKAADYGIVGDAFEVVPKLIQKLRAIKQ